MRYETSTRMMAERCSCAWSQHCGTYRVATTRPANPGPRRPAPDPQGSVTAPRSAPVTRRAYLASTPGGVAGRGMLEPRPPALELGVVHQQVDGAAGHVDADPVAVGDQGDRAAVHRLGGDVADAEAVGPAARTARR